MVLDKIFFFKYFPFKPIKSCEPGGGAIFDPRDIIWTNFVEVF